jgi:hypothetical protein
MFREETLTALQASRLALDSMIKGSEASKRELMTAAVLISGLFQVRTRVLFV